jgi:TRAP transporter TAXI family solute receptor
MNRKLRQFKQAVVDIASTWGIVAVVIVSAFAFTYQFVEPAPPKSIVMATGAPGGAYELYGEQLANYLATQGIEVELVESAGSVENLQLLEGDNGIDIGFVQGGLAESMPTENVLAVGSMYWEPVWLFVRSDVQLNDLDDLAGKRVAVGAEGSGTNAVVTAVLREHGVDAGAAQFLELPSADLADSFASGAIDAAFLIGAPESGNVASLLVLPGITLQSLPRAAAYARRHPYFSTVSLPQGALDLRTDIPATDIQTVALTAMLAANSELHPALFDLLLVGATDIFGGQSLLADAGQFPTARFVDLPLSEDAARYFKNGPPFLMRYLPFWAAALIDRLWIMVLPLIGLAIPLVKLVPPAYRWRIRRRLLQFYADLEQIDPLVNPVHSDADRAERIQRLEELDVGSVIGSVPKSYIDDIYKLRRDIDLVRRRLHGR